MGDYFIDTTDARITIDASGNITGDLDASGRCDNAGNITFTQTNMSTNTTYTCTGVMTTATGSPPSGSGTWTSTSPSGDGSGTWTASWQGVAFVSVLNPTGSGLIYSTNLSGVRTTLRTQGSGAFSPTGAVAVDGLGNIYVTGSAGTGLPTTSGAFQSSPGSSNAFLLKINPKASGAASLAYGSYLGGSYMDIGGLNNEFGTGIARDSANNIYVMGATWSNTFPTTTGAPQRSSGTIGPATYPGVGFVGKITDPVAITFTVSGFTSPVTAGTSSTFTVKALNSNGTTDTAYTGTVQFTASDGQATLAASYTFKATDNGAHTFTATLKTARMLLITATDSLTGNMAGTQVVTVNPAAASQFLGVVLGGGTESGSTLYVSSSVAFSLILTVEDQYGNICTGYTGTFSWSSTDSTATLPSSYTLTAGDAGVHTFTGFLFGTGSHPFLTCKDGTVNDTFTVEVTG